MPAFIFIIISFIEMNLCIDYLKTASFMINTFPTN